MFTGYRLKLVLFAVFALAAALIAVQADYNYVGRVKVIEAATNLSRGVPITPTDLNSDLKWVYQPKGALNDDTVTSPNQVLNYVPKGFIPAGTVLRQAMFNPPYAAGIAGQLALLSESGTTYYAAPLGQNIYTTVGGQVRAGDYVDIFVNTSTEPLASDVEVLSGVAQLSNSTPAVQTGILVAVTNAERTALLPYISLNNTQRAQLVLFLRPATRVKGGL